MSFFEGAENTTITGGTQIAVGVVNIDHGGQLAISPAFRELSAAAAHTALHNSSSRYDAPRCYQNTRTKQLGKLERWMLGLDDHDKNIIWLSGGAGAGKSAIMQSIIERCSPHGVVFGSFFFSRSDPSRNYAEVLIPTLAYQVARAFPAAMTILEPIINHDPLIFNASLQTQAYELLVRPILYLIEHGVIGDTEGPRGVFVIDGLDECSNPKKQALIIDVVASILKEHSLPVLVLIASRVEPAISDQFHRRLTRNPQFSSIFLDDGVDAQSDIRRFIEDMFLDIIEFHPLRDHIQLPWPADLSIHNLVWKSSGHFVYAATAMRFIGSHDEHPERALKVVEGLVAARGGSPFAELDALYRQILNSAKHRNHVLDIMRFCFLTNLNTHLHAVSRVLDVAPHDIYLFLTDVQSLVSIFVHPMLGHLWIQPRHASLRDFFLDQTRSQALYMPCSDYHALSLTRFPRLLNDYSLAGSGRTIFVSNTRIGSNQQIGGGDYVVLALCTAINHSLDIDSLDKVIRRISSRDIWSFSTQRFSNNYLRLLPGALSVAHYMSAIRDSAANNDNSLYLHHFPTYVQVLLDTVAAPTRKPTHNHVVPALLFSSGRRALNIIQPLLFNFCLQFKVSKIYPSYLLHLADSRRRGTDLRTWQALKLMPQRNISWSADLATAMTLVLTEILGRHRRPPLHFFNLHEQWLRRRKPEKWVAIGSPPLPTRHYGCHRGWPKFDYDDLCNHNILFTSGTDKLAFRGHLWHMGFRCILLLKAIIFFLRKADCTAELAKLARKTLPRDTLFFPKLMKKARREMDVYVLRWEESTEAFFERAKSLVINDLD